MRRAAIAGVVLASALVGGAAGVALFSPSGAGAATTGAAQNMGTFVRSSSGHGFTGRHHEAVSDLSVAAKAIGVSESDLTTALGKGQTIAQVAKSHNVDVQKVIAALVADARSELAADVKSGRLTQAQANRLRAGIVARVTAQVNGKLGPGGPGHGFGHHEAVSDLSVAATAIGVSESDLTTALGNGQSIAEVAKSHNVDVQKVIAALVADARSELAADVKSGRLTQADANRLQAGIVARVTAQVNGQGHLGGRFGPGRGNDHDADDNGPAATPSSYS